MIRRATPSDVMDFIPNIREEDAEEVRAITGLDPLAAVSIGFFQSDECVVGVNPDGELVGLFGVVPIVPNEVGSVWFLSTPAIEHSARHVLREGRAWLDEQNALYPVLKNYVAESNEVHLRLTKHLGFKHLEPIENIGADSIRAIPIVRHKQCADH